MYIAPITSLQNEKIKNIMNLSEKSKFRKRTGLFVVEGYREVMHCLQAGYKAHSIYFNTALFDEQSQLEIVKQIETLPQNSDVRFYSLSKEVYAKVAYRESTEGLIAVINEKPLTLEQIKFSKEHNPLVLVVESVEKPGNLGALLRTADACGLDAVLVCDPLTDLYNPNLIRSSLGGIFTKQVVACTNEEAYQWLKKHNIAIFTAQLQDSEWYYDTNFIQPSAIVMGNEAAGLTDFWRKVSNAKIKIPMLGQLDSLNVSVSAAILCYEAVRQRNSK
ncbi:MAG: RNA methyltransferase [Bacteroidales bacterium]|nr:RNA methyltransferase [Bacteroidales bacterium]